MTDETGCVGAGIETRNEKITALVEQPHRTLVRTNRLETIQEHRPHGAVKKFFKCARPGTRGQFTQSSAHDGTEVTEPIVASYRKAFTHDACHRYRLLATGASRKV